MLCSPWTAQSIVCWECDLFTQPWNSGAWSEWMQRTGCLKKASKQQGLLPLPGSSDVSNSPIHLPGRGVHEDGPASPPRGTKEEFCVAPAQKQESDFPADSASVSRDIRYMGCTALVAPFAWKFLTGRGKWLSPLIIKWILAFGFQLHHH